jgi:hypothetical protein
MGYNELMKSVNSRSLPVPCVQTIQQSEVNYTKREKIILFPLVVDFNPRLPDIGKILKKHFHLIQDSSELQEIFPPRSIIPSFRRPKTIKEIISTKRRQETSEDQSPKGCYKCGRKCDFCNNYMHESSTFVSSQTGVKYQIKQNIRCNSQNVVYLITCIKCSRQYIGSTSTELKVRFCNHKSTMINNKRTCEVATHFNKTPHDLSDFKFIGIEQIVNDSDSNTIEKRLLTRVRNYAL